MCGIAGIVAPNAKRYIKDVSLMTNMLRHRGPDGDGFYFSDDCLLGNRRLAIVDIKGGDQPMFSRDGSIAVVFNGEIYGYKSLREELSIKYEFRTNSDTELILALYEIYGNNFVHKLPGMFAFAIYDKNKHQLICARDRFGEKPFYFTFGDHKEFIFSSEIKSILATKLVNPVIDRESVWHYMKHLYVHPSKTIYKNLFTLPPAHMLTYDGKRLEIKKYWHLPKYQSSMKLSDALFRFDDLFSNAVSKQLVADVPVGVLLSGGIDSSSVAVVAKKLNPDIMTFSFGLKSDKSELPYANRVAKALHTNHHVLTEDKDSIFEDLLRMQEIYDEPFADSSNIPTYRITKLAGKRCKVVLGGDGGDEMLGGYAWYNNLKGYRKFRKSEAVSKFLFMCSDYLRQVFGNNYLENAFYKQGLFRSSDNFAYVHSNQNYYFSDSELTSLGLNPHTYDYEGLVETDWTTSGQRVDVQNYLPGDILVKVDRASMANSLEVRAPFLDKDFGEFMLSIPYSLKINDGETKLLLRKYMQHDLPKFVLNRKKQGFGIGAKVKNWLEDKDISRLTKEIINNKNRRIYDMFDSKMTIRYLEAKNYKSWIILNLALWLEKNNCIIK